MARTCPRCGTEVPAGKTVCQRCEQPIGAARTASGVRYNPAGLAVPSPTQGHATVLFGIMITVALLGFFAYNSLQGIGPFTATVIEQTAAPDRPDAVTVRLRVLNEGTRAGAARCQVTGRSADGELIASDVTQSPRVEPKGTAEVDVTVREIRVDSPLSVHCS